MAWDEVAAAILGTLQGGAEGWQFAKKLQRQDRDQKAQEDRQARLDAIADEDRRERLADREQGRVDRERLRLSEMLDSIGRGGRVDPTLAGRARTLDLGHRIEETPDFQHSYFAQAGPIPMMVPERATSVAPTAAERLADSELAKERTRIADIAGQIPDSGERQAFLANPKTYRPSRESFLSMPARLREAQDAAGATTAAEVKKAEALLPIRLREREEGAKIDARYRPPSARDRGPTDFQTFGMVDKLNARFGSNTRATREVARQHQSMLTAWQALEKGTGKGTAEQAIVSTFNKILDPDSVVREGEYDRTAQGQAMLQRMQTVADNLKDGGKISRAVLKDMVDLAATYAQRAEAYTRAEQDRVGRIADRMNIDRSLIFTEDPDAPPPSGGAGAGGRSTAGPALNERRLVNGVPARWDGKGWVAEP